MSLFRDTAAVIRSMPETVANALDGWVLRQHRPVDVYGDGTLVWCALCTREPWPCREHAEVSARVAARALPVDPEETE